MTIDPQNQKSLNQKRYVFIDFSSCMSSFRRHAKIKLVAGNNVYYYIVSTEQKSPEVKNENYMRCDNNLMPMSSPSQSISSSR